MAAWAEVRDLSPSSISSAFVLMTTTPLLHYSNHFCLIYFCSPSPSRWLRCRWRASIYNDLSFFSIERTGDGIGRVERMYVGPQQEPAAGSKLGYLSAACATAERDCTSAVPLGAQHSAQNTTFFSIRLPSESESLVGHPARRSRRPLAPEPAALVTSGRCNSEGAYQSRPGSQSQR